MIFDNLFTLNRAQAFDSFINSLDYHSFGQHSSFDISRDAQEGLLSFIYTSIGQGRPKDIITNSNILIALDKNDLAYRFIQTQPIDFSSDFGTIVCLNEQSMTPFALHKQGNKVLYCHFESGKDAYDVSTIRPRFAAELLSESQDVGIQVFSQFSWSFHSLKELVRFVLYGRAFEIYAVFLTTLTISIIQLLLPVFTSSIFGIVVPQADLKYFTAVVLVSIPLIVSMSVSYFLRSRLLAQMESLIDFRLQAALVNRVLRQPLNFLEQFSVPDFVLRIQGFSLIRKSITNTVITSIFGLIFGFLNFIIMIIYEPDMAKYVGISYIVFSFLFVFIIKKQRVLSDIILDSESSVFENTSLLIDAIPQLRSSATEYFFLSKWAEKLRSQVEVNSSRLFLSDSIQTLSASSYQIAMVLILTLVAYDYHEYSNIPDYISFTGLFPLQFSSSGSFIAFIVAFTSFDSYFSLFMNSVTTNVVTSLSQWKRSSPLLYQAPELGYRPYLISHIPSGNIKFQNVSYAIGDRLVLDDLTLSINQGDQIGITGPSGSGKSTFIRLVSGVILANAGKVLIDDIPFDELNLKTLRSSIGIVTQVSIIPSTSIKDFLAPSFSYSDDEIWQALELACIADEIISMPMKLQTILSEGASNISGGQRQRLLIAKALIKKPRILLLDEATSALPESTQSKIIQNIQSLHVTSLSIAHRLDTIKACDQIHFFSNGKILESGTFDEMKSIRDFDF